MTTQFIIIFYSPIWFAWKNIWHKLNIFTLWLMTFRSGSQSISTSSDGHCSTTTVRALIVSFWRRKNFSLKISIDVFTLHSKTVSAILINSVRSLFGLIRPHVFFLSVSYLLTQHFKIILADFATVPIIKVVKNVCSKIKN